MEEEYSETALRLVELLKILSDVPRDKLQEAVDCFFDEVLIVSLKAIDKADNV